MNYQQQKTPRDLTLRGSMRFKKRVFCSPCESTGHRTTLNSTDGNGMNGAGLLCLKSARIQIIAPAINPLVGCFNHFFGAIAL